MKLRWRRTRVHWFVMPVWTVAFRLCGADPQTNLVVENPAGLSQEGMVAPVYAIEKFSLEYGPKGNDPHPQLPPVGDLLSIKIGMGYSNGVNFASANGLSVVVIALNEAPSPMRVSANGLATINQA